MRLRCSKAFHLLTISLSSLFLSQDEEKLRIKFEEEEKQCNNLRAMLTEVTRVTPTIIMIILNRSSSTPLRFTSRYRLLCDRPIVLLRPGHDVRGIPAVRSCKKPVAFRTFLRHFLGSSMALNDCFFFQLA